MNARSGYSLFEVLVAFAVMAVVLAVLLPGQLAMIQRTDLSAKRALAQEYALSRLEIARVTENWPTGRETYRRWTLDWTQEARAGSRSLLVSIRLDDGQLLAVQSMTQWVEDAK